MSTPKESGQAVIFILDSLERLNLITVFTFYIYISKSIRRVVVQVVGLVMQMRLVGPTVGHTPLSAFPVSCTSFMQRPLSV